ncbi:hypothetical protein [Limosilactobacillus caviae]|uniref:hypothetical protein n=1 Tax=Limosilactobacillus caviae TaxID=1769424 RepID=UPI001E4FA234|nr:hypothetical protein [Limosilactobacillus caviae]MCD7123264.1 hypothetical protein [Limosilactobacillus caviae]
MSKIVYKLNTENVYISARQVEDTHQTPANTTGILVMKGDYNRISSNVITIQDTNSKVVINGAANNNWVIYSTEGFAFQDGGNQSNKNIGI